VSAPWQLVVLSDERAAVTPAAACWLSAVVTPLLPGSWALWGWERMMEQPAGWEELLETVVILVMCLVGVVGREVMCLVGEPWHTVLAILLSSLLICMQDIIQGGGTEWYR